MEDLVDGADTVVDEDAADVRAIVWDERIKIVAGGSDDDDDDDDDQGDDGHDDTGEDDHDLSNQDPDSDD